MCVSSNAVAFNWPLRKLIPLHSVEQRKKKKGVCCQEASNLLSRSLLLFHRSLLRIFQKTCKSQITELF